jgi:carboxypeptidase C (cathepsin A)
MLRRCAVFLIPILVAAGTCLGWAAEEEKKTDRPEAKVAEPLKEETSVTRHTALIDGKRIPYAATAGTILLQKEDGKTQASVFFVAYTREDVPDPRHRPLTFAFNGGPGSSSVWLHLGALGPRRVSLSGDPQFQPPPYSLENNPYSLLDRSDLVFIDPVSTGFSRAAPGEDPKAFHGVDPDIESVSRFIRNYLTRFDRWLSPKLIVGESYGTTRAAGLAGFLQDSFGIYVNGLILVSTVLNFQTISFDAGNDLPYALFLPAYTATAWYHRRLPGDLQESLPRALEESEGFAMGDYLQALARGMALSEEDRREITGKISRLTGLSPDFVERNRLRVPGFRFVRELLKTERRIMGRFDSRFTGPVVEPAGESPEYDPSLTAVQGLFTAAMNAYVKSELGFSAQNPYEILSGDKVRPWDFGKYRNRYLNLAETLKEAMTKNPALRVFVAAGYFDLATPYSASDYTVDHLGLDPVLHSNILRRYYESGHMLYLHEPSLVKFKQDLAEFIGEALGGGNSKPEHGTLNIERRTSNLER